MKRLLLPLSCLLALSACWRHTRDWDPARDIPAGTLVSVTLQDVSDPSRGTTYLVDPRAGRVIARRDAQATRQDASQSTTEAQQLQGTTTLTTTYRIACAETKTETESENEEPACLVRASDPKHETDDPNPIMDQTERLVRTERFVVQLAQSTLQVAHINRVDLGLSGVKQQVPTPTRR
jgi:hypothetical protein